MATVRLKYMTYHPAVWPKMIGEVTGKPKPGALVEVLGKKGDPFGVGFYNPNARMPLRMVHHRPEAPDENYFLAAIREAATLRRAELRPHRALLHPPRLMVDVVAGWPQKLVHYHPQRPTPSC